MPRHNLLLLALTAALLTALTACGDDGGDATPQPGPDAGTAADADLDDVDPADIGGGGDASTDGGGDDAADGAPDVAADAEQDAADGDADAPPNCDFPAPRLSDSEAARAVAAAPARCGQPAFTWLDDPSLGQLVESTTPLAFSAEGLAALLATQDIASPRPVRWDVEVGQLSYLTQDRGQLIEASMAAAWPTNYDGEEPLDVLLFLHGTVGFNDACAPSSGLETQAFAALFASFGYVVVAPDYIGLKALGEDPTGFLHPYLVGTATAIASLDAVRAVGRMEAEARGGVCAAPRVMVLGGSQGGHAALWVDRVAPHYAPELELLGTVATVPPTDLLAEAERALTALVDATANTIAVLTAYGDWYGIEGAFGEVFASPLDTQIPEVLATSCSPGDEIDPDNFEALADIFQPALLEAAAGGTLADFGPWGCALVENSLTRSSFPQPPTVPDGSAYGVLYVTGESDALVHTPIERASYTTLCEQGLPLRYLECAGASHTATTLWALPEILDFIEARQSGEPMERPATCEVTAPVTCEGTPR